MKILFATDQYLPTPGGISVVTQRLSQELAKKGHDVAIIAPSQSWKFHREKENDVIIYRIQSILVHKLKKVRYAPAFLYQRRIAKIFKTFQPDIIHLETPDAIALTAFDEARRLHIPVIGTCHIMPQNISGSLPFLPSQIRKFVGNLYMKQLASLFNKIDFVTAPTETGIAILKAHGVRTPMQVLSNGIDLAAFHSVPQKAKETLETQLQIPKKPIILYVGRLDKEKRVDVLVKALGLLQHRIDFHAVIAGTGEQYVLLQVLIKKLRLKERITFLGMLPEESLVTLYNLATVFVMPSTAELQSLVTMEAMAVGKPVIGAQAGALPYLITPEKNGYLFKPDDAGDLARKLEQVLESKSLQKKMGEASEQLIQQHDIHVVVQKLENLYKEVIQSTTPYHTFMPLPYEEAAL